MDFAKLKEPFYPDELEWRPMDCGKKGDRFWVRTLAYVTNRAIMDRLDSVLGPENWQNRFITGPGGGVLCCLSVRVADEWVEKWDGAENTDIEAIKGGLSGAMKRSAVQWGIGRYLYDLEENFGEVVQEGIYSAKTKAGEWFNWNPPNLPAWAIPGGSPRNERSAKPPRGNPGDDSKVKPFVPSEHRVAVIALVNSAKSSLTPVQFAQLGSMAAAAGNDTDTLDAITAKLDEFNAANAGGFT